MLVLALPHELKDDLFKNDAVGGQNDFELFIPAMKDRLSALRLFARVAHLGSFSAGGRDLQVPQPTVSRVISELESELGAALFTRTTRAVSLTDAGADFLARIEPLLSELEEAEHAVRGTGELRGTLRVGLSSTFAVREVAPRLPAFMDKHPKLRIELITSDQRQDFVSEGVDVGMRMGPLSDSSATAKLIAKFPRVVFAAPSYLEHAGTPNTPSDLTSHSVIGTPSRVGRTWSFTKKGKVTSVTVTPRLMVTFNEVGTAAAVAGLGVVSMTKGAARKEMAQGLLVQILTDWTMDEIEFHAVFPAGKAAKPAARAFVDFLAAEIIKNIDQLR
jgi:DNA-binding transcriptional LysR family regulator